jgi:FMN-dependent NADH-azoreductase
MATLVERVISDGSLPHIDANYAEAQHSAAAQVSADGAVVRSEELIRELEAADVLVIATPMHNLGVPSALKAWIDHVVRARRTFQVGAAGKTGGLRDRPVLVAVASGGRYTGERARQADFLTPYLSAVLGTMGLHDLHFFSVQGTGLGPEALAEARAGAEQTLAAYFSAS